MAAFQFRVKDVDQHEAARLAEPLQRICADAGTAFIINDSVALAKRLGADGVHLGQSDGEHGAGVPALAVDVELDVPVAAGGIQVQQLRDEHIGDIRVERGTEVDHTFGEQMRVHVEHAVAPRRGRDDMGDEERGHVRLLLRSHRPRSGRCCGGGEVAAQP